MKTRWISSINLRRGISGLHSKTKSIAKLTPNPSGFRPTYNNKVNFNVDTKAQSTDPDTKKRSISIHTSDQSNFSARTKNDEYLDPVQKNIQFRFRHYR